MDSDTDHHQETFGVIVEMEDEKGTRLKEIEVVKAVYQDRKVVLSRREGVVVF
jgi:hypothetical protein